MGVSIKGGPAGSVKKLKKDIDKRSGSGTWMKYIPADGEMVVRFMTEPDEWFKYDEHYIEGTGFFPCIGDDCPGCAAGNKPSRRYAANVLDIESDKVVPVKLPVSLANRLIARHDRRGTLCDRDHILFREGKSKNKTEYDVEAEEKSRRKLDKYEDQLHDLEAVLVQQFEDTFEDTDDDDDDDRPRRSSRGSKSKRKTKSVQKVRRLRVEDDDEDDEDDEDERPIRRRGSSASKSRSSSTSSRRRRR